MNSEETLLSCLKQLNDDEILRLQKIVKVVEGSRHQECFILGTYLAQINKLEEALDLLAMAVGGDPRNSDYHCNLGVVEHKLNLLETAKLSLQLSIQLNPQNVDALYNLGKVYKDLNLTNEAIKTYQKVLEIDDSRTDAHLNLGNLSFDLGDYEEAINHYKRSIEISPKSPRNFINIGNTYRRIGKAADARTSYQKATQLYNSDGLRIKSALTLPIIYSNQEHILESRLQLERDVDQLLQQTLQVEDPTLETTTTNFYLAYQNMNNAKLQAKIAKLHIKSCPKLSWISPNCRTKKRSGGKIKIGFISTYFRNHSVGKLMVGLILNLPRESFEIFIITQRGQQDKIAKKIEQSADSVIYFSDNFFDIQRDIAELSLDVLIYGDIGMDIRTYFLAFSRLAFVQAVFWGHPDTTGIPAIDYFFSSKLIESPEASEHYTEKLVLFDNLPTYYQRPIVPERLKTRTEFGFDESKTIYFCPQTAFKFHPDIDEVFGQIIELDPSAIILVLQGAVPFWTDTLLKRWRNYSDKLTKRIIVIPRQTPEDFLALQALCDVILDTPHFSGGNTSFDAFHMDKSIITLDSEFMRGRVTSGMYKAMGLFDTVATDLKDYAGKAIKLGRSVDFRLELERQIAGNKASLFSNKEFVMEFTEFVTDLSFV